MHKEDDPKVILFLYRISIKIYEQGSYCHFDNPQDILTDKTTMARNLLKRHREETYKPPQKHINYKFKELLGK